MHVAATLTQQTHYDIRKSLRLALLIALVASGFTTVVAQQLTSTQRTAIFEASVVVTPYDDERGDFLGSFGSGTIVSPEGHVLTNFHVVGDDLSGEHYTWSAIHTIDPANPDREAERRYWARYIAGSPDLDIAVLKIEMFADRRPLPLTHRFQSVTLGDVNRLTPGDPLAIFGFPGLGGYTITVTSGVMSGWLGEDGVAGGRSWIKTDAAIRPGNSGGGVFDATGQLVAIPTMTRYRQREGDVDIQMSMLRPITLALPLLQEATAVPDPSLSTGPGSAGQGGGSSTAAACEGVERLHLVSGTSLQVRNALRLNAERLLNGPTWSDAALASNTANGLQGYQFVALDRNSEGAFYLGLAVDPQVNFVNDAGGAATAVFSCVEALGDATLAGAFAFGSAILGVFADSGLTVLDRASFLNRFPGALAAFPTFACTDWECSDQLRGLAVLQAPPAEVAHGEGESSAAAERPSGNVPPPGAVLFWSRAPEVGTEAQLAFETSELGELAYGTLQVTQLEPSGSSEMVTIVAELTNQSACPVKLTVDLESVGGTAGSLGGMVSISAELAPGATSTRRTVVWVPAVSAGAVAAVTAVDPGNCTSPARPGRSARLAVVSDAAELSEAIAEADVVVVRPGTYALDRTLVIGRSIRLLGYGPERTTIRSVASAGALLITSSSGDSDAAIEVRDIAFEYIGEQSADVIIVDQQARGRVHIHNVRASGGRAADDDPWPLLGAGIRVSRYHWSGSDGRPAEWPLDVTISHSHVANNRGFVAVYAEAVSDDHLRLLGNHVIGDGPMNQRTVEIALVYDGVGSAPYLELARNALVNLSRDAYEVLMIRTDYLANSLASAAGQTAPWAQGSVLDNSLSIVEKVNGSYDFFSVGYGYESHPASFFTRANAGLSFVSNRMVMTRPVNSGASGFDCLIFTFFDHEGDETDEDLTCYSSLLEAELDPAFSGWDNRVVSSVSLGLSARDWGESVDLEALIAEHRGPVSGEEPRGAAGGPTPASEVDPVPESQVTRTVPSRLPYAPDPVLLASVARPPDAAPLASESVVAGACERLDRVFADLPRYGDEFLDSHRSRLEQVDGCQVIAAAVAAGETHAELAARLAAVAAELEQTRAEAERCVAEQAVRAGLDGNAVLREVYSGDLAYAEASILLASCGRAVVQSHLSALEAGELARQASSYVR